ncbi:MAG: hypothetical protein ACE5HB_02410 [Terriglobia bacterium]
MHNHKHRFGLLPPLSFPLAAPATPSQRHPEAPRSIGAGRRPVPALFVSALLLCVLCASAVALQATTVQGSLFDAAGQPLASGEIILRLSQEGTVTDPALLLIQPPVVCTITSGAIAGGCTVRGNDTISPAGTFYKVRIITSSGQELLPERNYTINGATFDIGAATPLASATVAATAYQQIQDEGTNITKTNIANFTGSGVTVTHDAANNRTNISITGGGAGSTHQIDGINLTAQDPINLQDTAEIDFTNPAAGNIQAALKPASVADSKLASNYSGVGSCAASQWVNALTDGAAPTCAQPAFSDLSGSATLAQLPVGTANQLIKTNAGASSQEHATLSGTASEIDVTFGAGTITIGLVDPLAIAKGGTGATTASAAFDALSPMTILGDIILIGSRLRARTNFHTNSTAGYYALGNPDAGTVPGSGQIRATAPTVGLPLLVTRNAANLADVNLLTYSATDELELAQAGSPTKALGAFEMVGTATFTGGVNNDGAALKHARVSTGAVAAGASAPVTLTWTTAFADANYTVNCSVVEATASTSTLRLHHIESVTATAVVLRVINDDPANAKTATLHCIALHD